MCCPQAPAQIWAGSSTLDHQRRQEKAAGSLVFKILEVQLLFTFPTAVFSSPWLSRRSSWERMGWPGESRALSGPSPELKGHLGTREAFPMLPPPPPLP